MGAWKYPRRRGYYVPITRSGSSILASLITQWLRQPRRNPTTGQPGELLQAFVGAIIAVLILGFVLAILHH